MEINIKTCTAFTKQHYNLLLSADPNQELVDNYLPRALCFEAIYHDHLVGILVLLPTHPETLEIVNIAVISPQRNQGIGRQLLAFAEKYAGTHNYKCLEIGTGTTSFGQLYLYQKCGFRVFSVDQDFFTLHYADEIVENHLVLKDMLRLKKVLA